MDKTGLKVVAFILSVIAGVLASYFGGWGAVGAVVIGEIAMAITTYKV